MHYLHADLHCRFYECLQSSGVADTLAPANSFQTRVKVEVLSAAEREEFHSVAAKLPYMSKRAWPDLSKVIYFLTRRVLAPDRGDQRKLD